jgi:DNA-binding response OmpR family regulator
LALGNDNQYIEPAHVLLAMLRQDDGPKALFQRAGVNVTGLTQAAEMAMKKLPQVQGPDGDGWQVLAHFRNNGGDLPVILVSHTHPRHTTAWKSHEQFDLTLIKPVSPSSLLDALDSALIRKGVTKPSDAQLAELRQLIAAGEVTMIDQWARGVKASETSCAPYADQVLDALVKLDFERLRALAVSESK